MKVNLKKRNEWVRRGCTQFNTSFNRDYCFGDSVSLTSSQSDRGYCPDCNQVVIDITCLKSKVCPDCEALIDTKIPDGKHKVRYLDGRIEEANFWMGWHIVNAADYLGEDFHL